MRSRLEDLIVTADRQLASRSFDAAVDTLRTALGEPGAIEAGVEDRLEAARRARDESCGIVRPAPISTPAMAVVVPIAVEPIAVVQVAPAPAPQSAPQAVVAPRPIEARGIVRSAPTLATDSEPLAVRGAPPISAGPPAASAASGRADRAEYRQAPALLCRNGQAFEAILSGPASCASDVMLYACLSRSLRLALVKVSRPPRKVPSPLMTMAGPWAGGDDFSDATSNSGGQVALSVRGSPPVNHTDILITVRASRQSKGGEVT
jgi:hypothetical protein